MSWRNGDAECAVEVRLRRPRSLAEFTSSSGARQTVEL
jgi:hypothetical protein